MSRVRNFSFFFAFTLLCLGSAKVHASEPLSGCEMQLITEDRLKGVVADLMESELEREGGFLKAGAYKLYKKRVVENVKKACQDTNPCDPKLVAQAFKEAIESVHSKIENFSKWRRRIVGNTTVVSGFIALLYTIEVTKSAMPPGAADIVFRYLAPYAMFGMALQAPYTQKLIDHMTRGAYRLVRGKKSANRKHDENVYLQEIDDNLKTTYTKGQIDALSRFFALKSYVEGKFKDALTLMVSQSEVAKNATPAYVAGAALTVGRFFESVIDPKDDQLSSMVWLTFTDHISDISDRQELYAKSMKIISENDPDYPKYEETRRFYEALLSVWLKLDEARRE